MMLKDLSGKKEMNLTEDRFGRLWFEKPLIENSNFVLTIGSEIVSIFDRSVELAFYPEADQWFFKIKSYLSKGENPLTEPRFYQNWNRSECYFSVDYIPTLNQKIQKPKAQPYDFLIKPHLRKSDGLDYFGFVIDSKRFSFRHYLPNFQFEFSGKFEVCFKIGNVTGGKNWKKPPEGEFFKRTGLNGELFYNLFDLEQIKRQNERHDHSRFEMVFPFNFFFAFQVLNELAFRLYRKLLTGELSLEQAKLYFRKNPEIQIKPKTFSFL